MKKIIEENYKITKKRGLINSGTSTSDFISKLDEEVKEFKENLDIFELADIILVCLNYAKYYNIDIETALKNKIKINKKRIKK